MAPLVFGAVSVRRALKRSLPLNGGGRLPRDVVDNTVNARHFVDDAVGNLCQQGVW